MKSFNNGNFIVGAAPQLVGNLSTQKIMMTVCIALLPSLAMSTYVYGFRCILLALVTIASAVFFEWLYQKITKKDCTINDLSAVVTGLILSMNLPPNLPFWMACVGSFIAIFVVKQLFGGMGQNFANPAITARIALFLGFATAMTSFQVPYERVSFLAADAVTGATPLGIYNEMGLEEAMNQFPLSSMFVGGIGGSMGEVSAVALLIGGIFLIATRVISPAMPVSFLGTMFVYSLLAGQGLDGACWQLCAGGAMLGAFFMATDYVTSPITPLGKVIGGIFAGLLTMTIRIFGSFPEGVSFSILLMNIVTPHIDTICEKILYGGAKK